MATARVGRLSTRPSIHVLQKERGSPGILTASHICMTRKSSA